MIAWALLSIRSSLGQIDGRAVGGTAGFSSGRAEASNANAMSTRASSPLSRHRDQGAVNESTSRVSTNLAEGLENLLEAAVDGPLQRAFGDVERRFAQFDERVSVLETENELLKRMLNGMPLAEQMQKLEEENGQLRADMEKEVRQRHRETEEINTVLRQVSLFVESLENHNARSRRHVVDSTMRGMVWRMQAAVLGTAWNEWKSRHQHTVRVKHLVVKALHSFEHHQITAAFYTWQSWTRVQAKEKLRANQGVGQAFLDLKQQMETEVAQRHYEVEQINTVMKQLALVVESSDTRSSRERAHHIQSNMTKIVYRIANQQLAVAWSGWHENWLTARRRHNALARTAATWLHKTLVKCFNSLAAHVKLMRSQKHKSTVEVLATEIVEVRELARRTTDGIEDLIRDSVTHMYYMTAESQRQAEIQRTLQKVYVRLTKKAFAAAFEEWKKRHRHKKRLANLRLKAAARFFNYLLAMCFQPWAASARQQTKNRHEATVMSNFEQLAGCTQRVEDMHQSLLRIFTNDPSNGGVYSA